MKNKKGFTLIELLAIIVILAIIAVITVPIILNIIENSKKGAASDSAYGFKEAVRTAYIDKLSTDSDYAITDGTYTVSDLKNQIGLSLSGKEPSSNSWITIANNNVTEGCLQYDEYKVSLSDGKVINTEKGICPLGALKVGDEVGYSTTHNGVTLNDWRVFYIDGDDVWLILSDYLPYEAVGSISGFAQGDLGVTSNYSVKGTGSRIDLINALSTESNWLSLKTGTINGKNITASHAMGGPTLDLWKASWNENHEGTDDDIFTAQTANVMNDGLYGTYINKGSAPSTSDYYTTVSNSETLWFPHTSGYEAAYGYWLISVTANADDCVSHVYSSGIVGGGRYYSTDIALRPVVSLSISDINS